MARRLEIGISDSDAPTVSWQSGLVNLRCLDSAQKVRQQHKNWLDAIPGTDHLGNIELELEI